MRKKKRMKRKEKEINQGNQISLKVVKKRMMKKKIKKKKKKGRINQEIEKNQELKKIRNLKSWMILIAKIMN